MVWYCVEHLLSSYILLSLLVEHAEHEQFADLLPDGLVGLGVGLGDAFGGSVANELVKLAAYRLDALVHLGHVGEQGGAALADLYALGAGGLAVEGRLGHGLFQRAKIQDF